MNRKDYRPSTTVALDNLRLSGRALIMKWQPGESRRLRVLPGEVHLVTRHWVETKTTAGEIRRVPIPCLGLDCHRVVLPDGRTLHQVEIDEEYRVFVWSFEFSEVRILAGKAQIFGALQDLQRQFGDITRFDIVVSCVPSAGRGGRRYQVTPTPTGAYDLAEDVLEQIGMEINADTEAIISPSLPTIEEVLAKLPGATETVPGDEEGLLASEPAEETE